MTNRREFLKVTAGWLAISGTTVDASMTDFDINIGQALVIGFRGVSSRDPEVDLVRRLAEQDAIAGVLLLERNIESPEQLAKLISSLQSSSKNRPLIIAIDQEGGAVTRLGPAAGFKPWVSAQRLSRMKLRGQEAFDYYYERASELADVGINVNLGPVVDLNTNPSNPIIGGKGRSYGNIVENVLTYADAFIRSHTAVGIRTCLKHFPGHGSSTTDSHIQSSDIRESWTAREIAPFERLTHAGMTDMIMNSHVIHEYLSDSPWIPTSLSKSSVEEIRIGLNFNGPIITDDMQMGAIAQFDKPKWASLPAIRAGNNLLIYSNYKRQYSPEIVYEIHDLLKSSVRDQRLSYSQIERQAKTVERFRKTLLIPH